jgi:ABC-type Fe3+/spermidine/putrescine transport system ATPase subunit
MSSRIVVLDRGAIQQVGNPFEIYNNPKSRFVADFIGEATFLEGYVEDVSTVESTVNLHGLRIKVSPVGLEKSSSVVVSIRPENVRFLGPSDSLKNELPGRITSSTYRGANVEYRIRLDNGKELRSIAPGRGILYPSGEPVRVGWDLEDGVVIRS